MRDSPGAQGGQGQGQVDYGESATSPEGSLIGPVADSDWLHIVPWGFRNILGYLNHRCERFFCVISSLFRLISSQEGSWNPPPSLG